MPTLADYFKYANGVQKADLFGTGEMKEYGSFKGTPLEGTAFDTMNGGYTEPTDTPDQFKGLLSYDKGPNGGFKLNPEVLAKLPMTKYGSVDNVQSADLLGGSQRMANPNAKVYDENYGWITPKRNLYEEEKGVPKYAVPVLQALASAGFGGIGGLATGLAGSAVGGASSIGNGGSPLSVILAMLPSLIGAGVGGLPPEFLKALQAAKAGYGVHQSVQNRNPVQGGLSLAQLAGYGG